MSVVEAGEEVTRIDPVAVEAVVVEEAAKR